MLISSWRDDIRYSNSSVTHEMKIRDLGFDKWFEDHSDELHQEGCSFARISAVDRGSYLIRNESGEVPAELTGKLSYQIESSMDLPCVGDWVTAYYYNDDTGLLSIRYSRERRSSGVSPRVKKSTTR